MLASTNEPRCSGRNCQPARWPDNIYGDHALVDILGDRDDDVFGPSNPPRPGYNRNNQGQSDLFSCGTPWVSGITAKVLQEGGAKLINLLLNKAAVKPSGQASGELSNVHNVCEWHYCDLKHFPEATQKQWEC